MKKVPTSTTATRFVRTIDATGKTLEQWQWEKAQENYRMIQAKADEQLKVVQSIQAAQLAASEYKRVKWGEL